MRVDSAIAFRVISLTSVLPKTPACLYHRAINHSSHDCHAIRTIDRDTLRGLIEGVSPIRAHRLGYKRIEFVQRISSMMYLGDSLTSIPYSSPAKNRQACPSSSAAILCTWSKLTRMGTFSSLRVTSINVISLTSALVAFRPYLIFDSSVVGSVYLVDSTYPRNPCSIVVNGPHVCACDAALS